MTDNHDDLSSRLRHGLNRGTAPELSDDLVTGAAARPAPHLPNPARTLRAAGGATLAVAALAVAAVVVVPSLMPRSPLFTAAGAAPASANALGTEDARSSDMKIGWWVDYNYTADPSLSTQPGRGQVYRIVLGADDPAEYTAELAGILGVDGTVSEAEWSDDLYPTWVVGPQDGTGTSLSFSAYGTGDWWFNDPAATPIYVCDDTVTAEQSVEYGCVLPSEAPANLAPTGDEARALAQELFASTGYDVDAADIELYSDDWGTTATAYLVVEGARTAVAWSANWSNTGELSYASGHALRVESQGTFDTVSPADAVTRLEDGRWWGSPAPISRVAWSRSRPTSSARAASRRTSSSRARARASPLSSRETPGLSRRNRRSTRLPRSSRPPPRSPSTRAFRSTRCRSPCPPPRSST
jgi:hypothetical protein